MGGKLGVRAGFRGALGVYYYCQSEGEEDSS